jgi:hypothetical protein
VPAAEKLYPLGIPVPFSGASMKQYEAVIAAMETLGGYATLGELYQKTLSLPNVTWGTKTPCATIRRIVQQRPEIFKIRPGLWALETFRNKLPAPLLATKETRTKSKEVQLFDHTYYQGLLVQIGNAQQFKTYVPAQDKNSLFRKRSPDFGHLIKTLEKSLFVR